MKKVAVIVIPLVSVCLILAAAFYFRFGQMITPAPTATASELPKINTTVKKPAAGYGALETVPPSSASVPGQIVVTSPNPATDMQPAASDSGADDPASIEKDVNTLTSQF